MTTTAREIPWLSPAQAGRALGITPQRIRQLVREERLRAHRTPLGHLSDAADVDRLAAERNQPHQPTDGPKAA